MNNKYNYNWLEEFLIKVEIEPERQKTFFDISNYPHYEDVLSNFYAFFFDKNEAHKLNTLFIDTLLDIINENQNRVFEINNEFEVKREVTTKKGGRVDIVIVEDSLEKKNRNEEDIINTNGTILIIENKIYHNTSNDFNDYYSSFKSNKKLGVLFTLQKVELSIKNFINIRHKDFLERVIGNIYKYFLNSHDKYLVILKDLVSNIENLSNSNKGINMSENYKEYISNLKKIQDFKKVENQVYSDVNESIINAFKESKYNISNQSKTVKNGRHFYSEDDKFKPFRFWVSVDKLMNTNPSFSIYFELHGEFTKNADDFQQIIRSKITDENNYQVIKSSKQGKAYYHILKYESELDKINSDFLVHITNTLKNILFENNFLKYPFISIVNEFEIFNKK